MHKRYAIVGYMYQSDQQVTICEVDNNPQAMLDAARAKTLRVWSGKPGESKQTNIPKYTSTWIVDREAANAQT